MVLVTLHCFAENKDINCVVCETEDKAWEYIQKEIKDKTYKGATHQISNIELYKQCIFQNYVL